MNASDVIVLSSLWEGSPNVIKEALACNRPIGTTKGGDVELLLKKIAGCYIVKTNDIEYAKMREKAILYSLENKEIKGRDRIKELGLDSESIANKIVEIYKNTL